MTNIATSGTGRRFAIAKARCISIQRGHGIVHHRIAVGIYEGYRRCVMYAPGQAGRSKPAHGVMYGLYHMSDLY